MHLKMLVWCMMSVYSFRLKTDFCSAEGILRPAGLCYTAAAYGNWELVNSYCALASTQSFLKGHDLGLKFCLSLKGST